MGRRHRGSAGNYKKRNETGAGSLVPVSAPLEESQAGRGEPPERFAVYCPRGNTFADNKVDHIATTPNEVYSFYPDNSRGDGTFIPASPNLPK